ncbi:hypothetical protein EUTSA_v10012142mg, partial [Eutrema salsugineum]
KFTWVNKNFSSLHPEEIYSDQFRGWRLLAYPKGNNKDNCFSLYLVVADYKFLPNAWRRHVKVSFTIVNQFSEKLSQLKEPQPCPWLEQENPDWGFAEMITLTKLNAEEGFLVNDELIIVVKVDVLEVVGKLDVSGESSPVTIDVKGFQVLPSQVESVKRLFERHQDIASNFLISMDDLADQYASLAYLTEAGFELGWLKKKLDKVKEVKEKEESCLARLKEMEEQL